VKPRLGKMKVSQGENFDKQPAVGSCTKFPSNSKMDALAENLNLCITKT